MVMTLCHTEHNLLFRFIRKSCFQHHKHTNSVFLVSPAGVCYRWSRLWSWREALLLLKSSMFMYMYSDYDDNDHSSSTLDISMFADHCICVSPGSSPLKRSSMSFQRRVGRVRAEMNRTQTRRNRQENRSRRESGWTAMETRETRRR